MSNERDKQVAKTLRQIADEIDPPLNQAGNLAKQETSETAQEAHEAALTSFNTILNDGRIISLNAAPPQALPKDESEDAP